MQVYDDTEHEAALVELRQLWGAEPGTVEGNRLDALFESVEKYEATYHAIGSPNPSQVET